MKVLIKKITFRNKLVVSIFLILTITYLISFIFFGASVIKLKGIESIIRYSVLSFLTVYFIMYFLLNLMKIIERKHTFFIITSIITFLLSALFVFSDIYIDKFYKGLTGFSDTNYSTFKTYLINNSESEFTTSSTIGMIEYEEDIEGYVLPQELIKNKKLKNEIIYYSDYLKMLYDLKNNVIDSVFVQGSYIALYTDEEVFEDINKDVKVVFEHSKKIKNILLNDEKNKTFNEPLSFLLIGVDSAKDTMDASEGFNGDVLMVLTINPKTLNLTMLSIPRDTAVAITCSNNQIKKINSSVGGGTNCTINTIEQLLDIKIDYYIKVNFKGVVDFVDALGGIEVDVAPPTHKNIYNGQICEQDSNRKFGANLICMDPGVQILNGEEALAYSRNRKQYLNDTIRNIHQQEVLKASMDKLTQVRNLNDFEKILNSISRNIAINMDIKEILSSYSILKKIVSNKGLNIETQKLEVYDVLGTTYLGYYHDSLEDIKDSLKINLDLKEKEIIKTFSFSSDNPFKEIKPGQNKKSRPSTRTYTSQIGKTEEQAKQYCETNNIKCSFVVVNSNEESFNPSYKEGQIVKDSLTSKYPLIDNVKSITFYINGVNNNPTPPVEEDPSLEEPISSED